MCCRRDHAASGDQAAIGRLVHQARLNPRGLGWRRFVIAEAGGAPVGVAQVRRHIHQLRDRYAELGELLRGGDVADEDPYPRDADAPHGPAGRALPRDP